MIQTKTTEKDKRIEKRIYITPTGGSGHLAISDLTEFVWQTREWEQRGYKVNYLSPEECDNQGVLRSAYVILA